jgi:hypothetical protein
MPSSPSASRPIDLPILGIFRQRPVASWVAIGAAILAALFCWAIFFGSVEPRFEGYPAPSVEADATTYFSIAGVLPTPAEYENKRIVSFTGNLFGPVLIAKVLREPFFVILFNFVLLAFMVHLAAQIPGMRRHCFLPLFFLNAESYVAIATLNKEILASVGLVAFAVAIYTPKRRTRYLLVAALFSMMARWEQLAVILLYMLLESRRSPFRGRHKTSLAFVLAVLTVAYVAVVRFSGLDLSGFLAVALSSGLVARLDNLQANFGLPIVIIPKGLMNLFNRLLLPTFFFSNDYWSGDFQELQGSVIIHLHTLAMLLVWVVAVVKHRLRFSQKIPFLIFLYVMVTSVSPFIQPRYQFPMYILLCLQLSLAPESKALADAPRVARSRPVTVPPLTLASEDH